MKTKLHFLSIALALLALSTINHQFSTAFAQGTAFTYQGRLNDGTNPANGRYSFKFTLYDALTGGSALAGPVTNTPDIVTNGVFTATIDFGAGVFDGGNVWLEIAVRTNGSGGFNTLTPRQPVTPTPYAITAENVAGAITVQNNTNDAPNIIGGSSENNVGGGVIGATIGGGGIAIDPNGGSSGTNSVTGDFGTIAGGDHNTADLYGSVSGGRANFAGELDSVGGGQNNNAKGLGGSVGGGDNNTASGFQDSTVAGGSGNSASGTFSSIGGGQGNAASDDYSTVGGGQYNTASAVDSTVSGGEYNVAGTDIGSTVSGGTQNTASGPWATVAGGLANIASGQTSFAAGDEAQAIYDGSFVWNDDSGNSFASTAVNQFSVHAAGGVRLVGNVTTGDLSLSENGAYHNLSMSGGNANGYLYGSYPALSDGIHLGYNYYYDAAGAGHVINTGGGTSRITAKYGEIVLAVGGVNISPNTIRVDATTAGVSVYGTFNNSSDRNAKQDFAPVSPSQILDKVLQLPVSEWSYKTDAATRHIGPMGQDFYSTFNIGTDEKHIAPIDEGGVAFAAIQGLNQKMESGSQNSEVRMQKLEVENAELKLRLEALEKIVLNQKPN